MDPVLVIDGTGCCVCLSCTYCCITGCHTFLIRLVEGLAFYEGKRSALCRNRHIFFYWCGFLFLLRWRIRSWSLCLWNTLCLIAFWLFYMDIRASFPCASLTL